VTQDVLDAAPTPAVTETIASHLHPVASYDLADHPVPSGREEVWRFTPLKRLRGLLDGPESAGHLRWDVSAPPGVQITEVGTDDAIALGGTAPVDRLAALAVARSGGAVHVHVAREAELEEPVRIRLTGSGDESLVWGHVVVTVGDFAKATVIFEHEGSAVYSGVVQVVVGQSAQLQLASLQLWDADAVHSGQLALRVGRDAQVRTITATLGGDLVRLVETAEYAGPGGAVEQLGLYFADAGQHLEHRLFVDHNAPRTRSNVDFRGALQGAGAHTVWVGDVLIRKVAEAISTYESNRNLVLTDGARADSVPNLEIETGEIVGAGHASATGRFDDEQLFYLQARGIPQDQARRLVVRGFFADIVQQIGVPDLQEQLMRAIDDELALSMERQSGAAAAVDAVVSESTEATATGEVRA